MKKLLLIAFGIAVALAAGAQAPAAFNYQAVARNNSGEALTAATVAVRLSVLDASSSGPVVYAETQQATTNAYGLFSLAIGRGTPSAGSLGTVNWGAGDKFLKVEVSLDGGASYLLQGTAQLLSVPYALYAQRVNLAAGNGIAISGGNTISGAYTGSNGILISGSAISGNYTGSNGVSVSGSTISGAYTGANGVTVSGGTISGAYTGSNGVLVSGNTISGNYQAGTGITIAGNTISAPNAGDQWVSDAAGIHYQDASTFGNVGIGTPSQANTALSLLERNLAGGGSAAFKIDGQDTWQTMFHFNNLSSGAGYQFNLLSTGNVDGPPGAIGISNTGIPANTSWWIFNTDGGSNNFLAIGSYDYHAKTPKSPLHVFNGDVNIDKVGSGLIMKSPNGQCWRVTIDNSGNMVRTAITCP